MSEHNEDSQVETGMADLGQVEAMALSIEGETTARIEAASTAHETRQAEMQANAAAQNAMELQGALAMAKLMVKPMFAWWPDFEKVWSDDQIAQISEHGGVIFERHGWSVGGILSEWGPYIGLIAATAPPAVATYGAIKAHKAAQAKEAANGSHQQAAN